MARTLRKCLVIWCGNHKQTPRGLRKTDEAKAFRRKLLRRPIALRGDTEHFQPNMLGKVVLDEPLINGIEAIIRETMGGTCLASSPHFALCVKKWDAHSTMSCASPLAAPHLSSFRWPCTSRSFLYLQSLQAAAGVIGHQRWADFFFPLYCLCYLLPVPWESKWP